MKIEAVKIDIVQSYLLSFSLDDAGTDLERASRLDQYFRSQLSSGQEMAYCETCQCYSFADMDECPFCGDCEELGEHEEHSEPQSVHVPIEEHSWQSDAIVDLVNGLPVKEVYTERDFKSLLREAERSLKVSVKSAHRAGQILSHIRSNKIWRLKRRRDAKPLYSNFFQAMEKELKIKKAQSYRLISMAKNYEPNEIMRYGLGVLTSCLPVRLPKEKKTIVENVDFKTRRACIQVFEKYMEHDLAESFRFKDEHGNYTDILVKDEYIFKKPKRRIKISPNKRIVEMILGVQQVPLWRREKTRNVSAKGAVTEPAMSLRDDPWGMLRLTNELCLFIYVYMSHDGTLGASVELTPHIERLDDERS